MFEIEMTKIRQAGIRREIAVEQMVNKTGTGRAAGVMVKWGVVASMISAFIYWIGSGVAG